MIKKKIDKYIFYLNYLIINLNNLYITYNGESNII